ncbi:PAS domain S-box protein, partial [Chloroflexota bacterium]
GGRKRLLKIASKTINKEVNGEAKQFEVQLKAKNGNPFWADITTTPVMNEGKVSYLLATWVDITERKKAEEDLKTERDYARDLVDTAQAIVLRLDTAGRIIYFNPYMEEISGYRLEEVKGKDWFTTFLPERNQEKTRELFLAAVSNIQTKGNIDPIITRDGQERDIEWYDKTLKDSSGNILGLLAIGQDITESKQTEEALKNSEKNFRTSLDNSPLGIIINQDMGQAVYANRAALRLYGFNDIEELKNSSINKRHSPENIAKFKERWERIRKGEFDSETDNHSIRRKDGESRFVEAHSDRIIWDGEARIQITLQDITEGKNAEEELKRYESIVSGAEDRLAFIDCQYHFLAANETYARTFGLTHETIVGKSAIELFGEEFFNSNVKTNGDKCLTGQVVHYQDWGTHAELGRRFMDVTYSPYYGEDNRVTGFISCARDITDTRLLEEEQEKASRLESVGLLAGGIAHDFNNILTGILGNIGLAGMSARDGDNEETVDRLRDAEAASIRARDLTQQLLTFAKGGDPVKKLVSISDLLRVSTDFTLRGSSARAVYSVPGDLWAIEAYEGQINQVINNIIINADQAMPEGGTINISAKNLTLTKADALSLPGGTYVETIIEDHGTGISPEHLQRIFEPYFTTKQKGSGLGLATCYSIIKNHGGLITAESESGIGTTFHICLPASKKTAPGKEEEAIKPSLAGQGRVLVMDDETVIKELLRRQLTRMGYEVELSGDGDEAIELYTRAMESGQPFDAVIMDLTIPGGMGGKEAIGKLLEIDPDIKAIVSSGYSTDPVMANYREYGFSGVAAKPYNISEIGKTLNEIVTRT